VLGTDRAHFHECLLETLQEMFGKECTDGLYQGNRLTIRVDQKQATVNLETMVWVN
jgi:cleavage and polyadenylation specificity factor subunit 3